MQASTARIEAGDRRDRRGGAGCVAGSAKWTREFVCPRTLPISDETWSIAPAQTRPSCLLALGLRPGAAGRPGARLVAGRPVSGEPDYEAAAPAEDDGAVEQGADRRCSTHCRRLAAGGRAGVREGVRADGSRRWRRPCAGPAWRTNDRPSCSTPSGTTGRHAGGTLGAAERNHVAELRLARNRWAHAGEKPSPVTTSTAPMTAAPPLGRRPQADDWRRRRARSSENAAPGEGEAEDHRTRSPPSRSRLAPWRSLATPHPTSPPAATARPSSPPTSPRSPAARAPGSTSTPASSSPGRTSRRGSDSC
jgi:hypothetical protein